jgi:hypothetical protein
MPGSAVPGSVAVLREQPRTSAIPLRTCILFESSRLQGSYVRGGKKLTKRFATFSLLALMCFPVAARAALLNGTVNVVSTIDISLGTIDFQGNAFTMNGGTGGFTALDGTTGTIGNITDPPDTPGSPLDVTNFMTFLVVPNISITLTLVEAGIDGAAGCAAPPAAAGQVCTPLQTPFNFQNTSDASSALSFSLTGLEVDSLTSTTTPITGFFTTQFPTMNFQQLLAAINSGGTVTNTISGQFSTVDSSVPEPNTWSAIAIGAAAIGLRYRSSLKKR